jgi:hypothetical protein
MRSENGVQQGEGVALRRRFLLDMAWPVSSDLLCHMFGLIDASPEVNVAERQDSEARMSRLAADERLLSLLVGTADDAAQILSLVENHDERVSWLTTYVMAVLNLLEETGVLVVEEAA